MNNPSIILLKCNFYISIDFREHYFIFYNKVFFIKNISEHIFVWVLTKISDDTKKKEKIVKSVFRRSVGIKIICDLLDRHVKFWNDYNMDI